jgi:RNA polymerase-binding transcription factor DksA
MKNIFLLLISLTYLASCSDSNHERAIDIKLRQENILDSISHSAQLKNDSIRLENEKMVKRQSDSFNRTPKGKTEIATKKKEQAKIEKAEAAIYKIMNKLDCSEEEAVNLLEGRIWIGMTFKMVKYERGLPDGVNVSNYGYANEYQAYWEDYTPSYFYFKSDQIIYSYN